jgi:simple sugar transport system permease protein
MFVTYIRGVIRIMILFLFGSTGEIVTEKSGHLNMGTPGIMCLGATGAVVGAKIYLSSIGGASNANGFMAIFMPLLFCLLFAGITGLLYCFLVDSLQCNQNVTGLIITMFGAALYPFVGNLVCSNDLERLEFTSVGRNYFTHIFPDSIGKANPVAEIFLGHGFLWYIAIALAIAAFFIIKKTRIGLSLRAVGENPGTSDASGVNVNGYKYAATTIGAAICGLGGVYYLLELNAGSAEYTLEGYGWIAVALVIFSIWNTGLALAGSFIFAIFYQLPIAISIPEGVANAGAITKVISIIPYVVTILVLIVISLFNKRETQPPAALGLTYFREDR